MYPIDDLKKYCDELRNTSNWGGQLEIQAICNALHVPITVHTAGAPGIFTLTIFEPSLSSP